MITGALRRRSLHGAIFLFILVVVSRVMWPQSQSQSQVLDLAEASPSLRLWLLWHLLITTLHPCRSRYHFFLHSYCLRVRLLYSIKVKYRMRTPSGQG